MRSKLRVLGTAGLLALAAAACGSSSGKPGGGSNGSGCAALGADCDRIAACEPGAMALLGFPDSATCKSYFVDQCNEEIAAPHSGLTASLAQQCGDAIAAASCADFLMTAPISSACLPKGGTIPNGGSCSTPWQCASGRCSVPGLNQCGTCVATIPLGQPCDNNGLLGAACADGLVCALTPTSATTQVCAKPVAMGAACADPAVCPGDGYCDPTTQVCSKLPAIGQACDPNAVVFCDPTQAGATCDSTTSTCEAVGAPDGGCATVDGGYGTCGSVFLRIGVACTTSDICAVGAACTGGVCTACDGTVVATSPAAVERRPATRRRRPPLGWLPPPDLP